MIVADSTLVSLTWVVHVPPLKVQLVGVKVVVEDEESQVTVPLGVPTEAATVAVQVLGELDEPVNAGFGVQLTTVVVSALITKVPIPGELEPSPE